MTSALEWNKLKRTGFFPAFLAGGLLAAAAPVVNIGARPESFVNKQDSPAVILMGANWQLMSMLLSFLLIIGACIMYHTEFADNAMQRMDTLPKRPESVFRKMQCAAGFDSRGACTGRCSSLVLRMEVVFCRPHLYDRDLEEHGIFFCHVPSAAPLYDCSFFHL